MSRANRSNLAILIAEESQELRTAIALALRKLGHHVDCAETGSSARRLLRERRFDVVVSDVLLADGDGIDVINAAKKQAPPPRIIVMTGDGEDPSADHNLMLAIRMGADGVMQKPFAPSQLVTVLEAVVAEPNP